MHRHCFRCILKCKQKHLGLELQLKIVSGISLLKVVKQFIQACQLKHGLFFLSDYPRKTRANNTSRVNSSVSQVTASAAAANAAKAEIIRLESLCEARTKELTHTKMQLRATSQAFDAMSVLVNYCCADVSCSWYLMILSYSTITFYYFCILEDVTQTRKFVLSYINLYWHGLNQYIYFIMPLIHTDETKSHIGFILD